jgi:membrane-associated phospholipid phosphatase
MGAKLQKWAGWAGWALLACVLLLGCRRKEDSGAEATGGTWRPILLPAPDAIRLPSPATAGSDREKSEVQELLVLQKQRTAKEVDAARFWNAGGCVRWNEIARDLVAKHRASHTMASRVYALLSVAQYDTLVATWNNKSFHRRERPHDRASTVLPLLPTTGESGYPSGHAALAAASAAVLSYLFPEESDFLVAKAREHQNSRLLAGMSFRSDVEAGDSLGSRVAFTVIEYARRDGSDTTSPGDFIRSEGHWSPPPNNEPIDPHWGNVRPWLLQTADQFRAPPPPADGSEEFRAALAEVRRFSDTRTQEQAHLAALWADGLGSYAPAGRWNKIAADLILEHHLNELRSARVFALVNMALMDAGISAWETKYHYLTKRPSQVDPAITTPVGEPNSPSYTCSHAAFSAAGATVLGYLFPDKKAMLDARAEEAADSRVYGGVQFRFEGNAGLTEGRAVGALAINRGRADGAP